MGMPGFDFFKPMTNYVKVYVTKEEFLPGDYRRMVYQSKPRAMLDDFFGAFDCPDAGQVTPAARATARSAWKRLGGERPEVADYVQFKAADPDRWLTGMRKLQRRVAGD